MSRTITTISGIALFAVVAAFSLALSSPASAATTTTWGTHVAINSNADIVNSASVIHAVNFGNEGANINVAVGANTVIFDPSGVSGGTGFKNDDFFDDNNPAAGTVSGDTNSEFHRVLDSFRDNGNSSYTFTGLTGGASYTLQVFHSDDRGNRQTTWNVDGTAIQFTNNTTTFRSVYILATVELGVADTSFTLQRTQGQINAAVLSSVQIPEPSTLVLAAIGLMSLAFGTRRRRRRA